MGSFDSIPFEVFITYILPLLSVREVGILAQVDSIWRDVANNNRVWKFLYLQITPSKILDTSVHIGPKSARLRDWNKEFVTIGKTGKAPTTISYVEGQPFILGATKHCSNSYWFLNNSWCCSCMPKDLKSELKSWREVRTDGFLTDDFPLIRGHCNKYNTELYCSYVNSEWKKYNNVGGYSTVNLCQNPDHYSIDSLGIQEDCKNKKSFKKATINILSKRAKEERKQACREKKGKTSN